MAVSIIPSTSLGHCLSMSAQRHSFCWQGESYLLDKSDNLEELGDIHWQFSFGEVYRQKHSRKFSL